MSPLKITARDAATGPVPEVLGALDHGTAPELRGLLAAVPDHTLRLMSTTGLDRIFPFLPDGEGTARP
ncbi:hypothetical protein [Streptomyces bikiniensis]|uniref:hypothetical protein n=1 Tax=Streptomyces bikiniensis TaxID=1896 RepID=UPI0004BF1AC2|nr:hypothetical protein [Streptomyces bikiniensis]